MDLSGLLRPQSIAILGATERPSISRSIIDSLQGLKFGGALFLINPKYDQILGNRCYSSLAELPSRPDVVALCVKSDLKIFRGIAEFAPTSVIVYGPQLANDAGAIESIKGLCKEAGIRVCGPNCMGALNVPARSSTYYGTLNDPNAVIGSVGWISQSGSIASSLLSDTRRFGFSITVSSGNETLTDTAAYIEFLIDDPETKCIATFTEAVPDVERYVAALDRAYLVGKPVVVLKAGRSRRARQAVATHTGGMAGESRVFSAILKEHKAIEVHNLDTMAEVLAVLHGKHLPQGNRLGVVTDSGGKAELILDLAENGPLELPPLPAEGQRHIQATLGALTGDGNPLDAWGRGEWENNLPMAIDLMVSFECYDAIAYCVDAQDGQALGTESSLKEDCELFASAAATCAKPAFLINSRAGLMSTKQVEILRRNGIQQLTGIQQSFSAIAAVASYAKPFSPRRESSIEAQAAFDFLGQSGSMLNEFDAKRVLAAVGLPVVQEQRVHNLGQGREAAVSIGYPVVLKAIADNLPHKTEYGLVELNLTDQYKFEEAWFRLDAILSGLDQLSNPSFVVQKYVPHGAELFLGILTDPQFGPMLALGIGGIDIEADPDFSLRPLPLRQGQVEEMLSEVRGARCLDASRGRPAGDRKALVECTYLFADFATQYASAIRSIDINPIKVLPEGQGCMIVDALIVTRESM